MTTTYYAVHNNVPVGSFKTAGAAQRFAESAAMVEAAMHSPAGEGIAFVIRESARSAAYKRVHAIFTDTLDGRKISITVGKWVSDKSPGFPARWRVQPRD